MLFYSHLYKAIESSDIIMMSLSFLLKRFFYVIYFLYICYIIKNIMTHVIRKKAKELVEKFHRKGLIDWEEAKQCAIIHINTLLGEIDQWTDVIYSWENVRTQFYENVKQEIEKL